MKIINLIKWHHQNYNDDDDNIVSERVDVLDIKLETF